MLSIRFIVVNYQVAPYYQHNLNNYIYSGIIYEKDIHVKYCPYWMVHVYCSTRSTSCNVHPGLLRPLKPFWTGPRGNGDGRMPHGGGRRWPGSRTTYCPTRNMGGCTVKGSEARMEVGNGTRTTSTKSGDY